MPTYSSNLKLGLPIAGETGWGVIADTTLALIDAAAPVGGLAVTPHEGGTSTTLLVDVAAGKYIKQDGSTGTYAGTTSFALTASNTNYIYLDGANSYALTKSTSSFPTTAHVRLATVVAGGTTLSSVTDSRQAFSVCGTWEEGVNMAFGVSTGTQIGTASSQKLAFLGATPVIQQTGGAASATGSWTGTEQAMLQKAYQALRTFGFLS